MVGMTQDWPDARGIWHNDNKNFLVWVNEEDHLQIICSHNSNKAVEVFQRCAEGVSKIESKLKSSGHDFMKHSNLGYLTTCPSHIGASFEASMTIVLPNLGLRRRTIRALCDQLRVSFKLVEEEENTFEIFTRSSLWKTESEVFLHLLKSVWHLTNMDIEKAAS